MNILKRWLACVLAFALIVGNTLGTANITYADVIGPSMEKIEDITIPHPYSTAGMERFVVNEDVSFSYWNSLTEESDGFDSAVMFDWEESEKENSFNPESKVYETANVGTDNSYAVAGMRFKNAAEVTFDYKTSCEEPVANEETGESLLKDDFIVIVDDKIVLQAGGETDWTSFHYHVNEDGSVSTEEHEIYWIYSKDVSEAAGEDCAFLSNVKVDGDSYELIGDADAGISLLNSGEDRTMVDQGETMTAGSTAKEEDITEESSSTTQEQGTTTETTAEATSVTTEETITEATNSDANGGIATVADGDVAMIVTQSKKSALSSETKTYSYYPTLESALEAAKNGKDDEKNWIGTTYTKGRKRVILIDDANISSDLVIPSGVTLILPFNDGNGDSLEESGDSSVAADVQAAWDSGNYLNHTLTVSENAKLFVNGKLIVAGVWGPKKQNAIQGLTCGSYSQIICNGDISIESGGTMEVYGLVTGEDGGITVKSGGSLTEPFLIADFPGGSILNTVKDQCFPLSQYGFNNIKSKIDIESGGVLIGKGKVHAASMFTTASVIIVGDSDDDAFIKLNSNSSVRITHLKIDFNGNKNDEKVYGALGKTKFTVKGGANIGKLAMKIAFYSISTQNKYLALPYTFDVELCTNENGEGTYNIDDGIYIKIMPGSKLTTQEGTSLNINGGRLVAYNGLIQKSKVCRSYPTNIQLNNWGESQSGELVVNGTLNINDEAIFAGVIQTDGLGNVNVSSSAILGVENFSDGFDLNDSNENIAYFNIPAKIWNGYSLENLEQGKYYSAYNGINSKVTKWNLEEFECITWSEGTTIHGTSNNGGNCTCTTNCTNNKYYVENEDNIKYTEPKIGAWNLTDIIYTADGDGYTIVPVEGNAKNPLPQGDTFKFKIVFDEGYSAGTGFAVKVNGTEIAGTEYEYSITIDDTINNGQFPDQVITVEGVVDTPPTGTIETSINGTSYKWEEVSDAKDTIKIVASEDSTEIDDSIKFTITGKDTPDTSDYPVTIQYCVSESKLNDVTTYNQWKTYDAEKGVVIPTDCKVYVYAKITDTKPVGGNITFVSTPLIIVDNNGPVGTITVGDKSWIGKSEDAEDAYYNGAQTVSITQSDNASDTVKDILYYKASSPVEDITAISDGEWITYNDHTPISIGNEKDETCIIYAKMEDNEGHISYAATGIITVDKTDPTVTVLADDETDVVNADKSTIYFNKESNVSKINIVANDKLSGVEKITYKVNGKETEVRDSKAEISISDGIYAIEVTVTDKSGNEKTVTCKNIIVDMKAPTGSISLGSYHNEEGETVLGDSWPKEKTKSTFYNKIYFDTYKTSENIEIILNAQDDGPSELSKTIYYYISSSKIKDFSNVEWKEYDASASPTIALNTKQYIYMKLTDNAGNETILLAEDIMVDTVSPTGSISIKETNHLWKTFLEKISFGAISFKETKTAEIKGDDAESQISKISYMETANTYDVVSKLEAAATGGTEKWLEYVPESVDRSSASFDYELTLNNEKQDRKVVVYAKVEDNSGNIIYLSSDGIILDDTEPTATITVGQAGDVWTKTDTDETVYFNSSYFVEHNTNDKLELFIQCNDGDGSGATETVEYILKEMPVTDFETAEWTVYVNEDGKRPALEAGKPQYAYFRIIDNAGNINIISVGKMFLDLTNPTGTIQLNDVETIWQEFLEKITFGLLSFNESKEVTVVGTDIDSTISSVSYMESKKLYDNSTELEEAVADGTEKWTVHDAATDPCEIKETISTANNDKKVVVYIKLEDKAGNISYLSSNGIIMDATAPKADMLIDEVSVADDGVQTEGEGNVLYYRTAKEVKITADVNLAPIEKIETWVFPYTEIDKTLDVNSPYYECHNWTADDSVASRTLEANSDSVIYAKITDKAGNITEIHSKQIIVDATPPEGTLNIGNVDVSKNENTSEIVYFNESVFDSNNEVVLDLNVNDEGGSKLTDTAYFVVSDELLEVTKVENWEEYSDTNKPTIPENELTYVYAKVVDNAGNKSYVISNPILLDTQLPKAQIDVVGGTGSWNTDNNEGISYYKGNELKLSITGEDPLSKAGNGSGIASIKYRITNMSNGENTVQMRAETEEDNWKPYSDTIVLDGNGKHKVEAKITDKAGNVRTVVTDTIVVDNVEPTAQVSTEKNKWTSFLNNITFGLFFNETQTITVSAEDACAGVETIQYVVSNSTLPENDVMSSTDIQWINGESGKKEISFDVDPEQRFIVYVKVTDKSGNVEYISTDGIVLDITKPHIICDVLKIDCSNDSIYEKNDLSYGTSAINVLIEETNLAKVALYRVKDDNTKTLLKEQSNENQLEISPAETHNPYLIEATDKAGNVSTCQFYYLKPCTVSFDNFNGAGIETLSTKTDYKYGETIVQPEQTPQRNEDKIQYQFAGWMDDATEAKYPLVEKDNAAVVDLPVVSANSVRYTAYYEEIAYKVTIPDSKEGEFSINYTEEIHSGWMDKGDVVSFKIENLDAYNLCTFDVKVNGESIDAQPDGTYAVTVDKVMDITVTSVEHKYKDEIEKEATCTEAGGLKRTCNNCDRAPEYIYMPMSGHNFGDTEEIVKEPTCTNEGLKIGECSYCKQYAEEVIPANGHDYDLEHREVVTEETCTTSGLTAAACKNCDDIKFATIPASHVIVIDDAKPATCTEPGLTEGSHCSRCNDVLEPQKEITNPTGHHWSEWSIQEDSTCTKEGTKIRNCTKCGESETLTIEVRNHDYKDVVTNPTCTDDGYTTHTCLYEACGHSYVDTYVEANGHTWGDWNTEVQATCTKDGQKTRTCSVSGCNETETVTIKSQGHQYEDKVVEPTCTNEGYTLHVCKVCGDEYRTDTVPAVGHKWDNDNPDIISVETCTAPGVKVVTCTKCAITKNVVTKAKGHSYKEDVTVDPTCTEAGYTVEICENCKEERHVDEKAALGHEIKTSEAKAPTCTEIGWEAYEECARENCDYSTYKELPATGHTEVVTEGYDATCTQKGATDAISCSVCNTEIKKSVEIPAKGHILVVDKGYEATCTTKGLEDGKHCIICGAVTQEQDVIPALKHDWKTLPAKVVNPPTCENAGLEVETCSRCELTRSVVIDATGHNYKVTDTVEKTCTTDGYTEQTCKNCGYVTKTDVETAPGHDLVTIEAQAVGCTIIGWEKYEKCNNCDYTTYKEISPTGHREAARNGKAATCMNAGKTDEIYCSVCDAILKQAENIPPTGHKITIDKGYEATCTAKGLGDGKHCSVCDDVIQEQKVIEPLGHDWDTVNVSIVNQPTCTNAGLKIETCKRCGVTRTVVMEALGHNYIETVVEPTCTKAGYTVKTCDKCGDVQCENETAALNHDIESHEAQAATCEAIGWDAYETCKREGCGYSTYVEIPATGHTKVTEPALAPTCTETGLTEKVYCSVCNEVLTAAEEIPAKGHVETTVSGIKPTCTEPGKSEGKYCIVCGDVTVLQKEIPALKHAWDTENAKVAVKPTCQESGTNVETCTRCEITRTVVTDPTGHIYGTGVVTAPTCTKDGYTTFTCTNEGCGHTKQENPTEKLGHTETLDEAVAPTCEKDGLTEGSHCSVCNEVLTAQEVIPATKHTLGDWTVETAPTCEKTGEERRYCLNHKCNHYESREIVATGHNYKTEVTAPTCTEDGYTVYTCQNDNCGKVTKSDVVKATGHKYSAKVKDPTCESDGYTTFTCSICDDTYNDYFKDKTGHTVVTDEGKAATCTDTGLTEGSHCSTCGKVLEGQEITSALEHNYDNGVVVEATCEKDGYTLKTCTRCDYEEKTDTVKAQGHIWCDEAKAHVVTAPTCTTSGMTVFTCDNCSATKTEYPQPYGHNYEKQVTPPTCEEGGYTTYTCSRCQDSYKENEVDALGHDYVEYEGQDATCTAGGWKAYHVCTRCEDENYEAIEATGHSYKENVVEATCTARGYTTFECEHCEHTYTGNYVDATGHQMGDYEVTTAPTCTDKGVETSKCIHCDYEVTREVEKSGHKYSEEVTEPTCTVNGYTTYTCTVCKDSYVDDIVKATGHEEVTDDAVKASCTEDGLTKGSHCAACGSVIVAQEVIKATGHTEKVDHAVDATCEKDGATEGKHCSVCGEILIAQEVIPAFGHTYENSKTIINPTCDTAGLVLETCATCGDTRLGTLEQLQHEYVSQTTEPTCTEDGNTTYICKLCKNSYVDEVTKATGHNYQEEVTEPTCTDKGYTTYVCKVCQDTYKDNEVAAKGHTSVVDEGKDATCTETGLTDGSHCGTCSVVLTEQTIIPAKGHSYEADVVSATCTTAGHTDYECTRCKHSYSSDITKATGHTYVSSITKEATESQNGILTFKCSGCQASYNRVIPADMNTWLVDRNTDSITINWNNVHPETNENIGYEIWSADQNGTFALQATVDETVNEYTLSGLVSGSEYKVYVKAFSDVSGKKVYGENSNILTTVTVPAKAGGLKVSKTTISSFGVVEWMPVVNAQGYELYYKTTKASYYKLAQEIRGNIALGQITGLKANKTYNIKVRAYTYLNGTKVYGEYSDVLVATTKLKTPTIKLIAKSKKITIKWSRIPGAEGYKIYRATSKNGKYKLIKTIKGNKKVTYTNTKLKSGKKYYYKVRAYRVIAKKTRYSAYSKVKYKRAK